MTYFKLARKGLLFFNALKMLSDYDNQKAFIICGNNEEGLYFDNDGILQSISVENLEAYSTLETTVTKEQILNDESWCLWVAVESKDKLITIDMGY